jgi:hypothetical protein
MSKKCRATLDLPGPLQCAVACLDAQVATAVLFTDDDLQPAARWKGEPRYGIDGRCAPVTGHHDRAVIDIDGKQGPRRRKRSGAFPLFHTGFDDAEADAVDVIVEGRAIVEPQQEEEGRAVAINTQKAKPHLSVAVRRQQETGTGSHDLLATALELYIFLRNRIGWLAEQEVACQQDD